METILLVLGMEGSPLSLNNHEVLRDEPDGAWAARQLELIRQGSLVYHFIDGMTVRQMAFRPSTSELDDSAQESTTRAIQRKRSLRIGIRKKIPAPSARGSFDHLVGAGERQSRAEGRHPLVEPCRRVRVPG